MAREMSRCVERSDGVRLARLMRMVDNKALSDRVIDLAASVQAGKAKNDLYERVAIEECGEKWGPVAGRAVLGRAALAADNLEAAYSFAVAGYNGLLSVCRDEGAWTVPVLRRWTYEARIIAQRADAMRYKRARVQGNVDTNRNDNLRDVETTLKKGFSMCWTDRQGKKVATLYVVSQLMKIYFRLNLLKLGQPIIRSLEVQNKELDWSQFPSADVVTYRFFVGRLRMFEDQYVAAEQHLAYAFFKCHRDATRNKRAVLEFLLAVRLRRGLVPQPQLLEKYGLATIIGPLVAATIQGDLRTFNTHLTTNQTYFVQRGTFLLLQKCKLLVYRNLVKKISLIQNKASQLKLHLFASAFAALDSPIDPDQVECVLATLIFKNLLKGYISHNKQTLVLSKKEPFPTVALRAPDTL